MKLRLLFESFYTHLGRKDMESLITQFAFGLGKQIHDDLLPLDDGLVVQVLPSSIDISGTNGEVNISISDKSISVGDKAVLDVSSHPWLHDLGYAMTNHKSRRDSTISKGLSDHNLMDRLEEIVKQRLGLI